MSRVCSHETVNDMIAELSERIKQLFPEGLTGVLLFGSYARNDAGEDSDIDVMYLVNTPRNIIALRNWQVGSAAADLMLEHGVVISPIVENQDYFTSHSQTLPFFRNIQREGVRISA